MNLEELARSTVGMSESAFVDRFPSPALVFASAAPARAAASNVDTPSGAIKVPGKEDASFSQTTAMRPTDAFPDITEAMRQRVHAELEDRNLSRLLVGLSLVVFLEKSTRNPFTGMITIGRASNNDHCLALPSVSKVHAFFSKAALGVWRLTDQKAMNGTWVDGRRLEPGTSADLADGAHLGLGPDVHATFFTPAGLHGFLTRYRSGIAV